MDDLKRELELHLTEALRLFEEVSRLRICRLRLTVEGLVSVDVDVVEESYLRRSH